jgi:hypothetical protein
MTTTSRWARRLLTAALLLAVSSPASAADAVPCLGPGVGRVLADLAQARAFDGVVPPGYRLERLDVQPDHIELGYDDDVGPAATVLLGVIPDGADARGPHFSHRIVEARGHASDAARAAMLGAAMIVDRAVPASEAKRCGGPSTSNAGAMPARAPAVYGVGVGLAEAAMLIAALVLGLRGPRRGRRGPVSPLDSTRPRA